MSDDEEPPPLLRAHRAKRTGVATVGRVDGGAIAVGLVVALATFAPTMADVVPLWLAIVLVAIGLFLGGFVAAHIRSPEALCGACHGGVLAIGYLVIVGTVVASTLFSGGDVSDLAVVGILHAGRGSTIAAIGTAIGFGAAGGFAARANRDTE